jgi:hypothetical protein
MDHSWPKIGGRLNLAHAWPTGTADGLMNRSLWAQEPVTQSSVTGLTCGNW